MTLCGEAVEAGGHASFTCRSHFGKKVQRQWSREVVTGGSIKKVRSYLGNMRINSIRPREQGQILYLG